MAIARLQRAYADTATREAWDELAELVTPDCRFLFATSSGQDFELIGAQQFSAFAAKTAEQYDLWVYDPINFTVAIDLAGTATGQTYSFEIEQDRQTGTVVHSYGFYDDEYVRRGESWLWSSRRYKNLARRDGEQAWKRNR